MRVAGLTRRVHARCMANQLWQIGIWRTGSYGKSSMANRHMAKRRIPGFHCLKGKNKKSKILQHSKYLFLVIFVHKSEKRSLKVISLN